MLKGEVDVRVVISILVCSTFRFLYCTCIRAPAPVFHLPQQKTHITTKICLTCIIRFLLLLVYLRALICINTCNNCSYQKYLILSLLFSLVPSVLITCATRSCVDICWIIVMSDEYLMLDSYQDYQVYISTSYTK